MTDTRVTHRVLRARVVLAAVLALAATPRASVAAQAGSLCNTPGAPGAIPQCDGATSLPVFNSQHYTLEAGTSIISKIASQRADVANSPELIEAVTATAAAVIKRSDLGTIAPTATADLTVVDLTHPHLQPFYDPRRALIALGNRANIDQVFVAGRVLVQAGRYVHGVEAAITSAGVAAIRKIWDLPEAQLAFGG